MCFLSELSNCRHQLESHRRQLTQTEQTCADLRRRDADTRESLAAKDAQIAVLRTRLDEADRDLAAKTKLLSDLGSTQDRFSFMFLFDEARKLLLLMLMMTTTTVCCQYVSK